VILSGAGSIVTANRCVTCAGGFILGCNMAMQRIVFDKLGPFDERFGAGAVFKSGEDTDYVLRAYFAGIPVEYVPDMVVYHFHAEENVISCGASREL